MIQTLIAVNAAHLAAIIICTALEAVSPLERFDWRSRLKGIYMEGAGRIVRFFLITPLVALLAISSPVKLLDLSALPWAVNVVLLVVVIDFLAYWEHRFEHRFLWPIHVVHHSPRQLHAANTWGHPLQYIPMHLFKYLPLALVNFGGATVPLVAILLIQLQTYWIHSQTRVHLGPLRKVIVDNRFHRIHHGIAVEHHDKNFGILFTVWDRIFGTAVEPVEGELCEIGVEGVEPPNGAIAFLLMPFKYSWDRYRSAFPRATTPPARSAP